MKHNLNWINQPLEEQRWLTWPVAGLEQGDIYATIKGHLDNYFTVTVEFTRGSDITAHEVRELIKSVPSKHWSRFSLWGMDDTVRTLFENVLMGR